MHPIKKLALALAAGALLVLLLLGAAAAWYVHGKQPQRRGMQALPGLGAAVSVQYDERGVPHIRADNEADLYRALGWVQAQDRLFQMEMLRRLARGELAEILGPQWLDTDRLFRTLRLRGRALAMVADADPNSPASLALHAYLEGINQFQASHAAPMEFDLLQIPRRDFTAEDVAAVSGYMAYSFAAAFKTEPLLTFVRDKLGPRYLSVFDLEGHPEGGVQYLRQVSQALAHPASRTAQGGHQATHTQQATAKLDWAALERLAQTSRSALLTAGLAQFQGSNAWVIAGRRTQSGKPLLAGDPHMGFSVPSTWYEAHLSMPGFDLYGHYLALSPFAMLGHNTQFGWSLTMFENDDVDLVAETPNPSDPNQVWDQDKWVPLKSRSETIKVKGGADVELSLRSGPHGPIVTDAFRSSLGTAPVAMWWAFLETDNPILEGFYQLNHANTLDKARAAVQNIQAPGLNVLWASADGDIAWWAAAKIPQRPEGVNPLFILDAARGEAQKPAFYHFSFNPQEEDPPRGYIVSANQQPGGMLPVPGYYLLPDRAKRLDDSLRDEPRKWTVEMATALQRDACTGYPQRVLQLLLPTLDQVVTDPNERAFLEPLQKWDGCYEPNSVAASLFSQLSYELVRAVFEDELGPAMFQNLLDSPALDQALPLLLAQRDSPWWDNRKTPQKESHFETVRIAWSNTLRHLQDLYGTSLVDWSWGHTHTLTHTHPLGEMLRPLRPLLQVGPFSVAGGREAPNNMQQRLGPAPWAATLGPSTRMAIDFGAPDQSLGINPLGQSGVLFDRHYADQAAPYARGDYVRQYLAAADVQAHTESTLILVPKH